MARWNAAVSLTWNWKRLAAYQRATIAKIDTGSYILIRRPVSIGQKRITLVKTADVKKVTTAAASLERETTGVRVNHLVWREVYSCDRHRVSRELMSIKIVDTYVDL